MREKITPQQVRALLDYDPETGVLTSKSRPIRPEQVARDKGWNARFAGKPAGCITPYGYILVGITAEMGREEKILAHRLAWAHYYGKWPSGHLDHVNRKRKDNAIRNLRCATVAQNMANGSVRKDNTSGVRGVSYQAIRGKWRARLTVNGKQVYYGYFDTKEEAIDGRRKASLSILGEFASERVAEVDSNS